MNITRDRLKKIIVEELERIEEETGDGSISYTDDVDSTYAAAHGYAGDNMSTIGEGLENITPENIEIVLQAMAQMGKNFAPAIVATPLFIALNDAIKYLKQDDEEVEVDIQDIASARDDY